MAIKAIKKCEMAKQVENTTDTLPLEKRSLKEDIPELLSKNKNPDKKEEIHLPPPKETSGFPFGKTSLYTGLSVIGLPIAALALAGIVIGGCKGFIGSVKFLGKLRKADYIKQLQKLRTNPKAFKPIEFRDTEKLSELKNLFERLGIKLKIKGTGEKDVDILREILYNFTHCYNAGKGKTVMPKKLILKNLSKEAGFHNNITRNITINRESKAEITDIVLHELGHRNDFRTFTRNPNLFENKELKEAVRKSLGDYATTNPDEFVAEMYSVLSQCHGLECAKLIVPENLIKLYRQLKGPSIPFIKEYSWYHYEKIRKLSKA